MKDSHRAMGMRMAALACGLAALLPVLDAFSAAPVVPKVDWRADVYEIDTEANTVLATGAVQFIYQGEQKAVMTCRRALMELGEEEDQVVRMTAYGPVEAEVTTKGRYPKHITAKCDTSATYVHESRTITMLGNVVGTMRQSNPNAKVRDLTLRGSKMVMNLKTGKITIEGSKDKPAVGSFTLPEKEPEEENTPQKEPAE